MLQALGYTYADLLPLHRGMGLAFLYWIPKFMQACSIAPEVYYSFNKEADVLTAVLVSRNNLEPLKPYYPGDYVNLEIPQLSAIPHPFTIASYWAEDPYSMTIYIRTFQENEASWTGALAKLCSKGEEPLLLKTKVDGVFGDRNHDYLSSKVMVIFAAGAAITTFMSLLKAIAAQIEATAETTMKPVPIEVHLICTFRYESELYAYGDFMHRITHDIRFTSWLHTEIYVSRPDKFTQPPECPSGQCTSEFVCGRVDNESDETTSLLSRSKSKYGSVSTGCGGCGDSKGCCMESSQTTCSNSCTSSSSSSAANMSVDTILPSSPNVSDVTSPYQYKSIPTFVAASSGTISTTHAKKDLAATTLILVVPMIVFLWSRAIPWEGTYKGETHWCRTTRETDQHMTNRCLWSYAMLPGIMHVLAASLMGYLGLWAARRTNLLCRSSPLKQSPSRGKSGAATNAYHNLLNGLSFLDPDLLESPLGSNGRKHSDTVIPKGSIKFKRGRIQVNQHIQELKGLGIGCENVQSKGGDSGDGVIVFGGGPEAFVDMIHESCKKADWAVDFHPETWAP
ncbi:hypothetical protein BGX27_008789 [Mortierella sp. AM989]|nr:hypothetical protein BGX27_008789 [Mortierella sp. AM989]